MDISALQTAASGSDIFKLVMESGLVVKLVLLLLIIFSTLSWAIILTKYRLLKKAKRESNRFMNIFWESKKLDTIYDAAKRFKNCPVGEVFKAGYIELINIKNASTRSHLPHGEEGTLRVKLGGIDNIQRALRSATTQEITAMEKMISFLATTGSSAPFIGLFGTVWGIMNSFINIGQTHDTSLAVVAPGISEALIATAVGLFAAIPAVIFYNYFINKIKVISSEMDNFANDFLNIIKRHFLK
ncbi:MAG: protein TolQ [Pseudomonadota bacterium]